MAISVGGANPTQVTVVSNTVTTNTTFNANAPNDRDYQIADNIVGAVNAGVLLGGFGLRLQTTLAGGGVSMTNNGLVDVEQATGALLLIGNGGAVTYGGAGSVINHDGVALQIDNSIGAGTIDATIGGSVASGGGDAVILDTLNGALTFTQAAGTIISTSLGSGSDVVTLRTSGVGNVVANLNGTIVGDGRGVNAQATAGAVTLNSGGNVSVGFNALEAVGDSPGLVTVNVTGGYLHALGGDGIVATANGTGGILVNMTGGQIGSAAQRVAFTGINAGANGAAGDVDITATSVFTDTGTAIRAVASNGNVNVTVNGTVDAFNAVGIEAATPNAGTTRITNNGTVSGNRGIEATAARAIVFNAGTVTGTSGTAIELSDDDDTLIITP